MLRNIQSSKFHPQIRQIGAMIAIAAVFFFLGNYSASFSTGAPLSMSAGGGDPPPTVTTSDGTVTLTKGLLDALPPFDMREDFLAVAKGNPCTDKVRHSYQHMYGIVLPYIRRMVFEQSLLPVQQRRPIRMLELGLGCTMSTCVGGSTKIFRKLLPGVEYHVFEYDMKTCRSRYPTSNLTAEEKQYIDTHLCEGDSSNPKDLAACGKKFGPFDFIIDDASHIQSHIRAAFDYFLPSKYLTPGGYYLTEDLHTSYRPWLEGTAENRKSYKAFANYVGQITLAKLAMANSTSNTAVARTEIYSPAFEIAPYISTMFISGQVAVFRKAIPEQHD